MARNIRAVEGAGKAGLLPATVRRCDSAGMTDRFPRVLIFGCGYTGERFEADKLHNLWTIGEKDGSTAGFAMAPGGYMHFEEDACFGVGLSDPASHWPYVHPGAWDHWAGGTSHTFSIIFGLKMEENGGGACLLRVDLADTHHRSPP